MMIAGVVSVICSLFVKGILASLISVGALLVALPIIMVYAYIVYRNERCKDNETNN